jgi:hypothetical protein
VREWVRIEHTSISILATGNLGRLHRAHLCDPGRGRLNLAHGTDLVGGVAGDANVVAALEGQLDVADLEDLAAALLGILASCLEDLIDEVVGDLEDGLGCVSSRFHPCRIEVVGRGDRV